MSVALPIVAAAALVGLWLALFFLGATAGGLIHLMPVAAFALVVKSVRRDGDSAAREESR
jgi:hypothetical protein